MGGQKKKKAPADFKVLKKKVGKKLKQANATSTSFQSKQLVIREQSVVADAKEESITSSRGLTVEELVAQTKHHNSRVRREAFQQLAEFAGEKCDRSPIVHHALVQSVESLAEGMNDLDSDTRNAFIQMLGRLLEKRENGVINAQHVITIMNYALATLTGAGQARRLDATKVVQLLIRSSFKEDIERIVHKLVPLFSDISRSVLGTTSSSLAKGSCVGAVLSQKSGKIMQSLKQDEEMQKRKKVKTAAEGSATAEMSLVAGQLLQASRAVRDLVSLKRFSENLDNSDAIHFVRAVLELFRHCREGKHSDATTSSGEALALAIKHSPKMITAALARDMYNAYKGFSDQALRRASLSACLSCGTVLHNSLNEADEQLSEIWLDESISWFLKHNQDQALDITISLLDAVRGDARRTDQVLGAFGKSLEVSLNKAGSDSSSCLELTSRLKVFTVLLPSLSAELRNEWIKPLPRVLWTLAGGGKPRSSGTEETDEVLSKLSNDAACLSLGFELITSCARMDNSCLDGKLWTGVAKELSAFWCAFTKSAGVIYGPFFSFSADLKASLMGTMYALPLSRIPVPVIKSWAEALRAVTMGIEDLSPKDSTQLVELPVTVAMRNVSMDVSLMESVLSFLLTVSLFKGRTDITLETSIRVLQRLWFEKRWPVCEMLIPALLQAYQNEASSVAWLEFAAAVLSCSGDDKTDQSEALTEKLCESLAAAWRIHNHDVSPGTYKALAERVSVEQVVDAACKGQSSAAMEQTCLSGWVDFLVDVTDRQSNVDFTWWGLDAHPQLKQKVESFARGDPTLASNLKLYLAATTRKTE